MDKSGWDWPNNAHDDEVSWIEQLAGVTEDFNRSYQQLNLGSTTADPDSGAIGRTSMSGSMRIPRHPSLRDNQISSARHSIDTSYEASEGYSLSPEGPVIAPQSKKSGGLKSLLKNVKKAFVPSGGKKSSKDQPEVIVQTTYRVDYAKRGRSDDNPDEVLFAEFRTAMDTARKADPARILSASTVTDMIMHMRAFGKRLQTQPIQLSLAQLIDDPDRSKLDDQVTSYVGSGGNKRVKRALVALRDSRAGKNLGVPRVSRNPYPDDQQLIEGHFGHASGSGVTPTLLSNLRSTQRRFSDWLRAEGKPSIASRLNSGQQQFEELKKDSREFTKATGMSASTCLDKLQKYQQVDEANAAWGMQPAKEAGWPQQPDQSPVSSYDQDQLWDEASRRGWSPPYSQRDDARSAPAWDDEPSSAGTSTVPDIGFRLGGWHHGSRPASTREINILEISNVAPSPYVQTTRFLIDGEHYTAEWLPGGIVNFIHHSEGGQASESRALGDTQWLGDEHISEDYLLLETELERCDPELGARMRFVDPAIGQLLRQGDGASHLRGLLGGRTPVDFLFLPVSDASPDDPDRRGSHWSLLFVDLRPRTGPVAYHYDSLRQRNYNFAAALANSLSARLMPPPRMKQQTNGHDCGVFVLAATRELVQRLQQQGQPALDLDDLVANRQALRNRLQR